MDSYNGFTCEECVALEALIDKYDLQSVVGTLACIANAKAEHIAVCYGKGLTSRAWLFAARRLDKLSANLWRLFK